VKTSTPASVAFRRDGKSGQFKAGIITVLHASEGFGATTRPAANFSRSTTEVRLYGWSGLRPFAMKAGL